MIVISGALVLVALVLLIIGVTQQGLDFVYGSIAVSLVALVFLVVGILQRRGEPVAAGSPAADVDPSPAGATDGQPVPARGARAAVVAEPALEAEEELSFGGAVLVVAGRPRYHIDGCRYLTGKDAEELDVLDARDEGFTACGVCKPDAALEALLDEDLPDEDPVDEDQTDEDDLDEDLRDEDLRDEDGLADDDLQDDDATESIPVAAASRRPAARRESAAREVAVPPRTAKMTLPAPSVTSGKAAEAPAVKAPAKAAKAPAKAARPAAKVTPAKVAAPAAAPTSVRQAPAKTGKPAAKTAAAKTAAPKTAAPKTAAPKTAARKTDSAKTAPVKAARATSKAATLAAPSTAATAAVKLRAGSVVVIPERGRFHKGDCRYVRGVDEAEVLTKAQASKQGYEPCGVCKP